MLHVNSTPALTTLYSMLLLYPSNSYSLFEIKDFPCNGLPLKTLKKVLDKYISVLGILWMCMNTIDPSISLIGVMLDSWPHWQQEIRGREGRTHPGSSELPWAATLMHPVTCMFYDIWGQNSSLLLLSELQGWVEHNPTLQWRQNLQKTETVSSRCYRDVTESLWIWPGSRVPRIHVIGSIYLPSWQKHLMPLCVQ